jgi:MFS family permease
MLTRRDTGWEQFRKKRLELRFMSGYSRDQKLFLVEAMLINSANVVTQGVFLTGMLVKMGASDFMTGLISSSATWSLMLSLVSSVVVESVKNKKALLTGVLLAFRLLTTLPVFFLPSILGTGAPTMHAAAAMLIAGNLVFSVFNTGFFIFFMDSLPKEGRLNYVYTRMFFLRIAYTVCLVAMGFLLDVMDKSDLGFAVVFCTGLAIGLADVYVLTRIQGNREPAERPGPTLLSLGPRGIARKLMEPLGNRRYARYLIFTFVMFFFSSMASSYTSLYQYKYLDLSMGFISVYSACTYVIMIAVTRRWAALERKIGALNVLALSSALMSLDFLVYAFLTKGSLWVILFSPIFAGIGASGYWACALPYRYDLMPPEGKTVYEGWNGMLFGAAGLFGAIVGGKLQQILPAVKTGFMEFSVFQIIYFFAWALALAATAVFWLRAKKGLKDAPNQAEDPQNTSPP